MSESQPHVINSTGVTIYVGDSVAVLPMLDACSVDSVVTDPPYGLAFCGQDWDGAAGFRKSLADVGTSGMCDEDVFEAWSTAWARGAWQVLKPGGHMAVFGGTRMWVWMARGIRSAGFQLRDTIAWLYSTGMPKSLDLSHAVDQHLGLARPDRVVELSDSDTLLGRTSKVLAKGQPVSDDARRLEGVGTAYKPGFEPILIFRKPVEESIVANVLKYGTGGLNIGAGRSESGRWPVNVALDDRIGRELDVATGTRGLPDPTSGKFQVFRFENKPGVLERPKAFGTVHTTVKPLALMRWLVSVLTPAGGTVLEPFAGSGTTIEAALLDGFKVVAIEKDESYVPLIRQRIERVSGDDLRTEPK